LKSKVVLNKKFKFKVINMFMGSMLMVTAAYLIYLNLSQ
jgi:hypothetical protein